MSLPRKDNQFLNDLAERLKALRKKRKLSQMRVTMDTGINIGRVESGKRMLSVYSVAILCSYYGVSMEEFFPGNQTDRKSVGITFQNRSCFPTARSFYPIE